jgi:spermidine/putrescine transport system substrate-binding protein
VGLGRRDGAGTGTIGLPEAEEDAMRQHPEAPSIRFTRRELLRQGGVAALALGSLPVLLDACSSDNGGGSTGATCATSASGPVDVTGTTLDFYSWQGYDIPVKPIKDWLKTNDVTLKANYINTHDDITAKFTTGGGKGNYNLSTYEAGWGPLYIQLEIPEVLDPSKVPNFQNAYEVFRTGEAGSWFNVEGKQYAFPFTWGVQGINYQSDAIDAPGSYRDLLEPEFKDKFGITDDPVATVVIGAYVLGIFKADSLYTPDQLNQIMDFWKQMKANARLIMPSYGNMGDLLASGEIVAGTPGWAAVNSFAADKGDDAVKHTVPKEGAATFCDAYMIPTDAPDADTAYAFINEALTPEAQAAEAAYLVQAAVIPEAVDLMDPATAALYPYDDIETLLNTTAPLEAIPAQAPAGYANYQDWVKGWEGVKAS